MKYQRANESLRCETERRKRAREFRRGKRRASGQRPLDTFRSNEFHPSPLHSPPDMNCYEINRACIYNIYVCVYTLRNKLWNEFKIVDLLSEQMKDFVILVRCMDGGCVRKMVACLILENYICVYRFENEQTSDLITCQPRLGWIIEIVDSDE